jgi:hypothetical protein
MPSVPLADFTRHDATHVISLGGDCAVAHNIRRALRTDIAYCFDWWLTPAQGAAKLLENPSIDLIYDPALIEPYVNENGVSSVRNSALDIQFFHEFRRKRDHQAVLLTHAADDLAKARARTARLLDRLLAADAPGHRIAFIRTPRATDRRDGVATCLAALAAALEKRFARAAYTVVLGRYRAPQEALPHGFARVPFEVTAQADWRGHAPDWDRFLAASGVGLAGTPA